MAGQFGLRVRIPRKSQGSFTCHKSATCDRRLYFPSEGRHAVDFFVRKIRRFRPGSNPRSWVPEVSMLTTRPPKLLHCRFNNMITGFDFWQEYRFYLHGTLSSSEAHPCGYWDPAPQGQCWQSNATDNSSPSGARLWITSSISTNKWRLTVGCSTNFYIVLCTTPSQVKASNFRQGKGKGKALRVAGDWDSQIWRKMAHEGGKVVSPTHRPPLLPGNIPGTHFC
jgi:hypothetical protein